MSLLLGGAMEHIEHNFTSYKLKNKTLTIVTLHKGTRYIKPFATSVQFFKVLNSVIILKAVRLSVGMLSVTVQCLPIAYPHNRLQLYIKLLMCSLLDPNIPCK